jgi:6-phosphogluconolactonase
VTVDVRVVADPARAAAELLAGAAGHVALSGGSTVGAAYALAASARPDWSGIHVWFGDERAVPPDDRLSNYHLVRATLLDSLSRPPEVHRVKGELGADVAAARYDAELEDVVFDLALNGIGPDGHTASLFPGAPTLDERERRAVAAEPGLEPFVPRVTATPPVFAAARLLVYPVTGEGKAEAVGRAFAEPPSPETPASLVRGVETIALLDAAAASRL